MRWFDALMRLIMRNMDESPEVVVAIHAIHRSVVKTYDEMT
jgi:hypothetical protein